MHEKSILLALLPVTLLAADYPALASWLPAVACFSMYPLLKKDGVGLAYLGVLLFYTAVVGSRHEIDGLSRKVKQGGRSKHSSSWDALVWFSRPRILIMVSLSVAVFLHASEALVKPPPRYPYIFDALFVTYSFVHLAAAAVYLNISQWQMSFRGPARQKKRV